MTNQDYDPQLALRQTIAGILDRPSIYMGGPSQQNLRRADKIIAALRDDARLMQALVADEPKATLAKTASGGTLRCGQHGLPNEIRGDRIGCRKCFEVNRGVTPA